jgi:hypothetical protein
MKYLVSADQRNLRENVFFFPLIPPIYADNYQKD